MIEAVIFDMDGVIADTEYYHAHRRKNFLPETGIAGYHNYTLLF